ncbi:uncharacterized protein DS421_3g102580 [Arachis hypogaea]|nr:uncharacterized protein DS421_3g102580 [Arachis hypogaea]
MARGYAVTPITVREEDTTRCKGTMSFTVKFKGQEVSRSNSRRKKRSDSREKKKFRRRNK